MAELTAPLLQPGQVILNKYEVQRFLGSGHFGQVFQVFNRNLQQVSALKVIIVQNPEFPPSCGGSPGDEPVRP